MAKRACRPLPVTVSRCPGALPPFGNLIRPASMFVRTRLVRPAPRSRAGLLVLCQFLFENARTWHRQSLALPRLATRPHAACERDFVRTAFLLAWARNRYCRRPARLRAQTTRHRHAHRLLQGGLKQRLAVLPETPQRLREISYLPPAVAVPRLSSTPAPARMRSASSPCLRTPKPPADGGARIHAAQRR